MVRTFIKFSIALAIGFIVSYIFRFFQSYANIPNVWSRIINFVLVFVIVYIALKVLKDDD